MNAALEFCCPLCKGELDARADAYACPSCAKTFPIVLGIPDFRVFDDPYIAIADDHAKGRRLEARRGKLSFAEFVRYYWSLTPEVDDARAARFVRRTLDWADRGRVRVEGIVRAHPDSARGSLLEIGCGTGGFLVAARENFPRVVGVDIAFRWLVIARKRFDEAGVEIPLVCACAEHLPFREQQFDVVFSEATLEHVRDQKQTLAEGRRVLKPQGRFVCVTTNRYCLGPEPHVRVWGVGYLPRRWMDAYVTRIRGVPYRSIRQLSAGDLRRMLADCGLEPVRVEPAELALGGANRIESAYEAFRRLPPTRAMLRLFGPLLQAEARRD